MARAGPRAARASGAVALIVGAGRSVSEHGNCGQIPDACRRRRIDASARKVEPRRSATHAAILGNVNPVRRREKALCKDIERRVPASQGPRIIPEDAAEVLGQVFNCDLGRGDRRVGQTETVADGDPLGLVASAAPHGPGRHAIVRPSERAGRQQRDDGGRSRQHEAPQEEFRKNRSSLTLFVFHSSALPGLAAGTFRILTLVRVLRAC